MVENALGKIHPLVLESWDLMGVDPLSQAFSLGAAADALASYRQGELPKDRVLGFMTKSLVDVFIAEDQAARKFEARKIWEATGIKPLPFQGTVAYGAYELAHPVITCTALRGLDLITTAYGFEEGAAFSFQSLYDDQGIRPALNRLMDVSNFEVVEAFYGLHQIPADEFFSEDEKRAALRSGAVKAIEALQRMISAKGLVMPKSLGLSFTGFGAVNDEWLLGAALDVRDVLEKKTGILLETDTSQLGNAAGLIYGGINDAKYYKPTHYGIF